MALLFWGDYLPEFEPLEYQIEICPIITNDDWVYLLKDKKILEKNESPIGKMNKIIKEVDEEMDKKIAKVKKSNDKKMDNLVKLDKKRDKKIEKCDAEMKMKEKKKR